MSKRLHAFLIVSGVIVGCAPPTSMVPVPPPGMVNRRIPPPPIDGGAQALGEQPASAATAANGMAALASTESVPPTPVGKEITTKSGLKVTTLKEGKGADIKPGAKIKVAYVGKLADGKQFDANNSFELRISMNEVIKGWDEGIPGMKVGERRKLVIPPELGYGVKGAGPIPPNSTLFFEVEALETN